MTCHEIETRLPAYRENLLPPEEQKEIAGHLASCHRCSRAFADLKKAEELVQGLAEVEPPPFFEQRIMSRVREEAGRKQGILRRLFYPLHIKIPIQALATLVVAVLAFHVYQQGGPEMKSMSPLPIPRTEQGKASVEAGSATLAVPPATAPAKRAPAGDLPEMKRRRLVAPPAEKPGPEETIAASRAPIREETPEAAKPAAPVMAAKEMDAPQAGGEALDKKRDRAEKQDSGKTLEAPQPGQRRKEMTADIGAAVRESRKMTSTPAPVRSAATLATRRSAMGVTIQVGDAEVAIREIEARLGQVDARIIERRQRKESAFLRVEIAAKNVAAFLDRLEGIGKVNLETSLPAVPDGTVTVGITIVGHP